MTSPLNPEAIATLAAGYVVGDLDRAEAEIFAQLLAADPTLNTAVQHLEATLDQVVYSLNSVAPPSHLQSAILAAATTSIGAGTGPTLPSARRQRLRGSWRTVMGMVTGRTVMGSVAALLLLTLGVDNYRLRQEHRLAQTIKALLQQSQTQLFSLKAVNPADPAVGNFVVNLGQRQGILAVQNLVAPPTGKVYRLWAIADGEKIPCGTLKMNSQGQVLDQFWMPADFYDTGISGLFVTLEASTTSRYPTGAIVLQSHPSTPI